MDAQTKSQLDILVIVPPEDMMGRCMLDLNERQRRFVCAMAVTGGNQREAYMWAGYNAKGIASQDAAASQLATRGDVEAAMKEEALRRMRGSALMAISTLMVIADPRSPSKDKDKIAASRELLDRIDGFAGKTEHTVVHQLDEKTAEELIEFIRMTAQSNNVDLRQLGHGDILEAEFTEVKMSSEGIEDLL